MHSSQIALHAFCAHHFTTISPTRHIPDICRSLYNHQNASLLFGWHGRNMLQSCKYVNTLWFTKTLTSGSVFKMPTSTGLVNNRIQQLVFGSKLKKKHIHTVYTFKITPSTIPNMTRGSPIALMQQTQHQITYRINFNAITVGIRITNNRQINEVSHPNGTPYHIAIMFVEGMWLKQDKISRDSNSITSKRSTFRICTLSLFDQQKWRSVNVHWIKKKESATKYKISSVTICYTKYNLPLPLPLLPNP